MNDILTSLFGDEEGVLSESSQATLTEAIDAKVNELVTEKIDLALESQDTKHTNMLQTLVEKYEVRQKDSLKSLEEKLDKEHSEVVLETFAKVDEDRTEKLVQLKEHYETLLNEKVKESSDHLVEGLDKYIDMWLDEHIPTDIIQEAAKKDYSQELLSKISNLVGVNESVTDDIREGMRDAHRTIEEQRTIIDKLNKDSYIAHRITDLPIMEQQYIVENFKDEKYDLDFVERNFDYVRTLFSKNEDAPVRVVQESRTSSKNVDQQPTTILKESVKNVDEKEALHPAMAGWVNRAKGQNVYGESK